MRQTSAVRHKLGSANNSPECGANRPTDVFLALQSDRHCLRKNLVAKVAKPTDGDNIHSDPEQILDISNESGQVEQGPPPIHLDKEVHIAGWGVVAAGY